MTSSPDKSLNPSADPATPDASTTLWDVIIVGAGLSGIGAAAQLKKSQPQLKIALLEARSASGGTWDLFRYPGVRSDSDMYTLGYQFKPWRKPQAIAEGADILKYLREAAHEAGIESAIHYQRRAHNASWCTEDARWTLDVVHSQSVDHTEQETWRCRFLYMCSGYYHYEKPHWPELPGQALFKGDVVHPQFWPPKLDYQQKNMVVVGSGATAVTLVPALCKQARHVTMLQRSASYVLAVPSQDRWALLCQRHLPATWAYGLARWKNILLSIAAYQWTRWQPRRAKQLLIRLANKSLGPDANAQQLAAFSPSYAPWDQRICATPDGDLFKVIRQGQADVVTGTIQTMNADGITLDSGQEIKADIVVLATGLRLQILGGMTMHVDGQAIDPAQCMVYKGLMLSGLPNLALSFGYTNASWTLKADLSAHYVCRLLKLMHKKRYVSVLAPHDGSVQVLPFLSFTSGYVQRGLDQLPQQGSRPPWRMHQNYLRDLMSIRLRRIEDGVLQLSRKRPAKPIAATSDTAHLSGPAAAPVGRPAQSNQEDS